MSVERVTRVMVLMSVVRLKAIGWVSSVFMVEIWDGGVCVEYCMVGTRCVLGTGTSMLVCFTGRERS